MKMSIQTIINKEENIVLEDYLKHAFQTAAAFLGEPQPEIALPLGEEFALTIPFKGGMLDANVSQNGEGLIVFELTVTIQTEAVVAYYELATQLVTWFATFPVPAVKQYEDKLRSLKGGV